MVRNNNDATSGLIGIILRFPVFLIIACLKIFIAAPFELIIKLVKLAVFVMINIMKFRYAFWFKNERLYREGMSDWAVSLNIADLRNQTGIPPYRSFPRTGCVAIPKSVKIYTWLRSL